MLSQSFVFALPILPRITLKGDFTVGIVTDGMLTEGAVMDGLVMDGTDGTDTPVPSPDTLDATFVTLPVESPEAAPVTAPPTEDAAPARFDVSPDVADAAPLAAPEIPDVTPEVSLLGSGISIGGISGIRLDIFNSSPNGILRPKIENGTIAVPSSTKFILPASIGDISSTYVKFFRGDILKFCLSWSV